MNIRKFSKKKAISPILATVILIAITLIAAVAIAGFVFGLFGSFTSTAQISVSSSNCTVSASTGDISCNIYFLNTGTGTGSVSGASISYGGAGYIALTCPAAVTVVAGGSAVSYSPCTLATPTTAASVNEAYTLEATASSGGQPLGAGAFSAIA